MYRRIFQYAVIATLCGSATLMAQDKLKATDLIQSFDWSYRQFVNEFRGSTDLNERTQIIKAASDEVNLLLKPHLNKPLIAAVLPKMATTKLIDLDPTLVAVIDDHPQARVRAQALLTFAKYAGNNERQKTCEAALGFLKQAYGELPYRKSTFAKEADEALYFFRHLALGRAAPSTVGEDVDGAPLRLSDYKGKVVMLRFWGDWCPACRRMYGFERDLIGKYRNQPFALIGVNSDSRDKCRQAQRESNLMWRSIWDGGTTYGPISTLYRISDWPTIVVIDANGVIQFRGRGLDAKKLNTVLDRLVTEAARGKTSVAESALLDSTERSP